MSTPQSHVFSGITGSDGKPLTIFGHFIHHVIFHPQTSNSSVPTQNTGQSVQINPMPMPMSMPMPIPNSGANVIVVPNDQLINWLRGMQSQTPSTNPGWLNRNQIAQVKNTGSVNWV